jgi:hypothetical protein
MARQPVKTLTFRGKRWRIGKLRRKGELGGCESPHIAGREIDVPIGGKTLRDLDTTIHEAIHACLWDLDEEAVIETASDIATALWRLGWRKCSKYAD